MSIGSRPAQDFSTREEVIVINNDPDPTKAQVILRTYSPISDAYQDQLVDMTLAPGNPELAAQIQKRNQAIGDVKTALSFAPVGAGLIAGGKFLGGLTKAAIQKGKGAFVQPSKVPLQITPATRGMPKAQQKTAGVMLDPTKQELTGLGKSVVAAIPFTGAYTALSSLQSEPLTGADLSQAVNDAKITQSQSDEIQKLLVDLNLPSTLPEAPNKITEFNPAGIEIKAAEKKPPPKNEEEPPPIKTLEDVGQQRFIDPDNLIAFVRNLGAGLSTTGQIGAGLVLGSKMAAEERAKRDILEEQEKKTIQKRKRFITN